jgi:hypothetical protein
MCHLCTVDEPTAPEFTKMLSFPFSTRSPQDRVKDSDSFLNWIRSIKPTEMDTPSDEFAKIDQMLPPPKKTKNESPLKHIGPLLFPVSFQKQRL